jgi:hypothetical protein
MNNFQSRKLNCNNGDLTAPDFTFYNEPRSAHIPFKDSPYINQSNFDTTNVFSKGKNTFIESQHQVIIFLGHYHLILL